MSTTQTQISVNKQESVFEEKFRPQTVQDIILPQKMKNNINKWIKEDNIPNMLLVSKQPGLGKTSLAHVLINELDTDALFINISLNGNIDTLRGKIQGFVTTSGFSDKHKIVVLDEFDGASEKLQKAMRGFTEEFSKSARFILTANYKEKIIEPLQNRLQIFDFDLIFKEQKEELIKQTAQRVINILKYQNIEYQNTDVIKLVKGYYPSTRSIVKSIQENSVDNKLEIVEIKSEKSTDDIINSIKKKDYETFRVQIQDLSTPDILFHEIYKRIEDFDIQKRPQITIIISKYSYQNAFARDQLVNIAAMGAEIIGIL
jgi:replication factor C small subunit